MLGVASILGFLITLFRRDVAYLLVLVWAFVGIAVKQVPAPIVVNTAWVAAGLMFVLAGYSLLSRESVKRAVI